ncbi:acetyl-CoA carboxylase [Pectobacterium fontis]|uniref:Acetyl-CoA carboxylase n=2 Tax=Pectobacterium fontis TaxID=2558042 RepID=A0A7V8ILL1_9GAMM|nr:acetyl-CoA carboxylase [Pectobacterium fontis]
MEKTVTLEMLSQLTQSLHATSISHLVLKGRTWSVHLTTMPSMVPMAPVPAVDEPPRFTSLCAPAPGRVLLRHPLLAEHFTVPGSRIAPCDLLAMVKVGALYLPVRSLVSGQLISFQVSEGDTVEFGQEIAKIQLDEPFHSAL